MPLHISGSLSIDSTGHCLGLCPFGLPRHVRLIMEPGFHARGVVDFRTFGPQHTSKGRQPPMVHI